MSGNDVLVAIVIVCAFLGGFLLGGLYGEELLYRLSRR